MEQLRWLSMLMTVRRIFAGRRSAIELSALSRTMRSESRMRKRFGTVEPAFSSTEMVYRSGSPGTATRRVRRSPKSSTVPAGSPGRTARTLSLILARISQLSVQNAPRLSASRKSTLYAPSPTM
jgi:hypothetical protein